MHVTHGNGLDAEVAERRLGEHGPEAQEAAQRHGLEVHKAVVEGLVAPEPAANVLALRGDAAQVGDDAKENQRDEHGDLDDGEDELDLAVAGRVSGVRADATHYFTPTTFISIVAMRNAVMYAPACFELSSQ